LHREAAEANLFSSPDRQLSPLRAQASIKR
jgi:hypothetical protein